MKTHAYLQNRTSATSDHLVVNIQPRSIDDPDFDQSQPTGVKFSHLDLFAHDPGSCPYSRVLGHQPVQAKLTVGAPNDQYEQEADSLSAALRDRVAEQVLNMPDAASMPVQRESSEDNEPQIQPLLQRQETEQEELQAKPLGQTIQREVGAEEEETLQMKAPDPVSSPQPTLETQLGSSKGGGSPLPTDIRSFMEPRFGADFSQVRVHTGSDSIQMNRDLRAQAFTHGQDVFFGAGKAPANDALTAHELTHVVQQTGGAALQKQSIVPGKLIQAKLQGSSEVLQAVPGGGQKWGRIKQKVSDYEIAEAA